MKSKVYFTKEITSESLVKIYESLNHESKGKVAVKISTGEPVIARNGDDTIWTYTIFSHKKWGYYG